MTSRCDKATKASWQEHWRKTPQTKRIQHAGMRLSNAFERNKHTSWYVTKKRENSLLVTICVSRLSWVFALLWVWLARLGKLSSANYSSFMLITSTFSISAFGTLVVPGSLGASLFVLVLCTAVIVYNQLWNRVNLAEGHFRGVL